MNKATATELAATLDVPAAVAEAIVRARTEKGRLASIDDLKQAAGGEAAPKIDARKDRLVFCLEQETPTTRGKDRCGRISGSHAQTVYLLACLAILPLRGAEWVTHSGDNQRTGWQKNETAISKDSVKNLKLLWKITLDTKQRSVYPCTVR